MASALQIPLHWKAPKRIFVNSMSDLFHEALPDEAIDRVFAIMALCPQHIFQVLSKRPERMLAWFRSFNESGAEHRGEQCAEWVLLHEFTEEQIETGAGSKFWRGLPNVGLSVSLEDQKTADERIPLLLDTPAAVRFVSYEPTLDPVDFTRLTTSQSGRLLDSLLRTPVEWHSMITRKVASARAKTASL